MIKAKRILPALLALLPLMVFSQAQVSWLETEHDFGVIFEKDGKVSCAMRFVNEGDSALVVARVRPSCGCTAGDFTRTPIEPGDTGVVTLTYNPAGRPGSFSKDVFVFTNGTVRRTQLVIKGNVISSPETIDEHYPVAVGALRLDARTLPLGEVVRNKSRMGYFRGYNASADTLLVTTHDVPKHLDVRAVPDTVPPGQVTTITVYFDAKKAPLWGLNEEVLNIMAEPMAVPSSTPSGITQVEVMALVTEDFSWLGEEDLRHAPVMSLSCGDRLDFGVMPRGGIVSRTFEITNKGDDKLLLRRLWTGNEAITASADKTELKRGKKATVTVAIDTSRYQEPMLNALLTIMTNDPSNPRFTLRLVGEWSK